MLAVNLAFAAHLNGTLLRYSCKVRLVLLKVGGNNCLPYLIDSTE